MLTENLVIFLRPCIKVEHSSNHLLNINLKEEKNALCHMLLRIWPDHLFYINIREEKTLVTCCRERTTVELWADHFQKVIKGSSKETFESSLWIATQNFWFGTEFSFSLTLTFSYFWNWVSFFLFLILFHYFGTEFPIFYSFLSFCILLFFISFHFILFLLYFSLYSKIKNSLICSYKVWILASFILREILNNFL